VAVCRGTKTSQTVGGKKAKGGGGEEAETKKSTKVVKTEGPSEAKAAAEPKLTRSPSKTKCHPVARGTVVEDVMSLVRRKEKGEVEERNPFLASPCWLGVQQEDVETALYLVATVVDNDSNSSQKQKSKGKQTARTIDTVRTVLALANAAMEEWEEAREEGCVNEAAAKERMLDLLNAAQPTFTTITSKVFANGAVVQALSNGTLPVAYRAIAGVESKEEGRERALRTKWPRDEKKLLNAIAVCCLYIAHDVFTAACEIFEEANGGVGKVLSMAEKLVLGSHTPRKKVGWRAQVKTLREIAQLPQRQRRAIAKSSGNLCEEMSRLTAMFNVNRPWPRGLPLRTLRIIIDSALQREATASVREQATKQAHKWCGDLRLRQHRLVAADDAASLIQAKSETSSAAAAKTKPTAAAPQPDKHDADEAKAAAQHDERTTADAVSQWKLNVKQHHLVDDMVGRAVEDTSTNFGRESHGVAYTLPITDIRRSMSSIHAHLETCCPEEAQYFTDMLQYILQTNWSGDDDTYPTTVWASAVFASLANASTQKAIAESCRKEQSLSEAIRSWADMCKDERGVHEKMLIVEAFRDAIEVGMDPKKFPRIYCALKGHPDDVLLFARLLATGTRDTNMIGIGEDSANAVAYETLPDAHRLAVDRAHAPNKADVRIIEVYIRSDAQRDVVKFMYGTRNSGSAASAAGAANESAATVAEDKSNEPDGTEEPGSWDSGSAASAADAGDESAAPAAEDKPNEMEAMEEPANADAPPTPDADGAADGAPDDGVAELKQLVDIVAKLRVATRDLVQQDAVDPARCARIEKDADALIQRAMCEHSGAETAGTSSIIHAASALLAEAEAGATEDEKAAKQEKDRAERVQRQKNEQLRLLQQLMSKPARGSSSSSGDHSGKKRKQKVHPKPQRLRVEKRARKGGAAPAWSARDQRARFGGGPYLGPPAPPMGYGPIGVPRGGRPQPPINSLPMDGQRQPAYHQQFQRGGNRQMQGPPQTGLPPRGGRWQGPGAARPRM